MKASSWFWLLLSLSGCAAQVEGVDEALELEEQSDALKVAAYDEGDALTSAVSTRVVSTTTDTTAPTTAIGTAALIDPVSDVTWVESTALSGKMSSSPNDDAYFGTSIDVSGDRMVAMGRPQGSTRASATVMRRINGAWTVEKVIEQDPFTEVAGVAVEGDLVAVGTRSSNYGERVIVYRYVNGTWFIYAIARKPAEYQGGWFGSKIDLSGNTLIVGGNPSIVMVPILDRYEVQGVLSEPSPERVSNTGFGRSVAIYGELAVVGAPSGTSTDGEYIGGRVHVYKRYGTSWLYTNTLQGDGLSQVAGKLPAPDRFGTAVAISSSTLAVAAPSELDATRGVVHRMYVFDVSTAARRGRVDLSSNRGTHVAVSGRRVLMENSMEVLIYHVPRYGAMNLEARLPTEGPVDAVAISADRAYVGLPWYSSGPTPYEGRVQTYWAKPLMMNALQ